MENHYAAHGIKKLLDDLPPLRAEKSPILAAILGFCFGGLGLGLYFQSWKDGVYPVLVLILLSIIFPGIGTLTALIVTSVWGFVRAADSAN